MSFSSGKAFLSTGHVSMQTKYAVAWCCDDEITIKEDVAILPFSFHKYRSKVQRLGTKSNQGNKKSPFFGNLLKVVLECTLWNGSCLISSNLQNASSG